MKRILYLLSLLALLVVGGGNAVAQNKWVRTALTDLKPTDQVVIVDVQNKYAMTNDGGGAKGSPLAKAVTFNNDNSELTSDIADNLKWNITSTDEGYVIYPNGVTDKYLYCINYNKGLRIGTGDNKYFNHYSESKYDGLEVKVNDAPRYIGVYKSTSKPDWRSYTSVNTNINTTSIAYYKLSSSDPTTTFTSLSFGDNADKTFWKGDTEGTTFTQTATLTPAVEGANITYSSSDENVAVVDAKGEVFVSTDKEGTATITATYAGDDTHASASASYTITVDPLYSNISELKTTQSGTEAVLRLTDAKVTYVDGTNHYLQDETGAIDIYNSNFNYKAGDVLNGIVSVTYSPYNGLPEVKDFSAIGELKVTSSSAAPAPEEMTIADAKKAENICKYVVIKNVTVTPGSNSGYATAASGNESIDIYKKNQKYVDGQYDLTGIVSVYSKKTQIAFISYAPNFTIDENADANAITAGENGTVTIDRTFNANAWNTLVLPFDLTAEELAAKFGADAKFATYIGTTKNNDGTYTLNFESATTLTANTPVFVWGANDEGIYEFSGVNVVKADPTSAPSGAAFSFTGSYDKTTLKAGDWFISSDNKFYSARGTETMNPMRAVFRPVSAAAAKGLSFSIDGGEATGISAITADGSIIVNDKAPMYNLAGQRVSDSYKGVVIQNGKKFIK